MHNWKLENLSLFTIARHLELWYYLYIQVDCAYSTTLVAIR